MNNAPLIEHRNLSIQKEIVKDMLNCDDRDNMYTRIKAHYPYLVQLADLVSNISIPLKAAKLLFKHQVIPNGNGINPNGR